MLGRRAPSPLLRACADFVQRRAYRKRWERPYYRDLWNRQQMFAAAPPLHRSAYPNWDYTSELSAVGPRFCEPSLSADTVRAALHVDARAGDETASPLHDHGRSLVRSFVPAYLRHCYGRFPEEGVRAVAAALTDTANVATVAAAMGLSDLIVSEAAVPYGDAVLSTAFYALVGALRHDAGAGRAELFTRDLLVSRLLGCNVESYFALSCPMPVLDCLLDSQGRAAADRRLVRSAGVETATPVYVVAVYSGGEPIGQAAGETSTVATWLACRDALRTMWQCDRPLDFAHADDFALGDGARHGENVRLGRLWPQLDLSTVDDFAPSEPLDAGHEFGRYKRRVEPQLGIARRQTLRHKFSRGTKLKKNIRAISVPTPWNI